MSSSLGVIPPPRTLSARDWSSAPDRNVVQETMPAVSGQRPLQQEEADFVSNDTGCPGLQDAHLQG